MKADITIFNPATVRDVSTFVDPTHYSQGVEHVLVNGKAVVSGGKITERRPGRASPRARVSEVDVARASRRTCCSIARA